MGGPTVAERVPEDRPVALGFVPAQKGALPEWVPAGGDDSVADAKQGRAEEEEGHDEWNPCGNVDFEADFEVVEEGEEEETQGERSSDR